MYGTTAIPTTTTLTTREITDDTINQHRRQHHRTAVCMPTRQHRRLDEVTSRRAQRGEVERETDNGVAKQLADPVRDPEGDQHSVPAQDARSRRNEVEIAIVLALRAGIVLV